MINALTVTPTAGGEPLRFDFGKADSVALTYRVMFGDEGTVSMTDDGTGRDAIAGDGIFTGVIPQSAAGPGEMVRWYVAASDTRGEATRGPLYADGIDAPEYFGTVVADISILLLTVWKSGPGSMKTAAIGPDPKTWPLGGIRNPIALADFWRFA